MEVILHLGAHKTATTFIQKTLQHNAELLESAGIFTPCLEDIRAALVPSLGGHQPMLGFEESLDIILPRLPKAKTPKRLVISDENIPGFAGAVFSNGTFYLDAKQRLGQLARWLPTPPHKIVFALRPYETFFSSAYAQWLGPYAKKHGPAKRFIPREKIQAKIARLQRGWPALIQDMCAVFPQSEIVVTEYSTAPDYLQTMFKELIGPQSVDLKYNNNFFWNRGLSTELVEQLEAQLQKGEANPDSVAKIRASRSKKPSDLAQNFWSDEQRRNLQHRYASDVATLKSMANDKLTWGS